MTVEDLDPIASIKKYVLVDGFDLVVDLNNSNGLWLHDHKTGDKYLDFYSSFASAPIGYNHPMALEDEDFLKHLKNAAVNKISNSDFYTLEYAKFMDTFSRVAIPKEFVHAFFISGGALAVENALKAAFDWKVKTNFANGITDVVGSQIIHFQEAFHGRSGYTLSLTNTADPRKYQYFPRFNWPRISNPKITYPINEHLEDIVMREQRSIEEINDVISKNGNDIAGLILEPIQSEGGDNHFRDDFLLELRKITLENDIMFILDEVQTGIGMTGKMWGYQHVKGLVPDLLVFGKKMQICGFLSTDRIDSIQNNVFKESSRINSTWGGNLVDMVRSSKYLEIIESQNYVENAQVVGQYMINLLQSLAEESNGLISNVRGKGLMISFDLPSTELRDKFKKVVFKEKAIVLSCGHNGIRFRPSLNVTNEEVDLLLEKLHVALNKIS
ncbi:MAG: L-lysine 6-transaminase [Candidatus Heimdallarchaeota archaeon]|nr:L-lysine 6-transaminase [Candidatus Heimdallarchaeota archaeon]MDH5645927.1 L-lysine 6-transaminase [Candidatus Heimdallarchaeota archaeon]